MTFDLGNRTVVEVPSKYNVLIKYPVDVEWVEYMPVKWTTASSQIEVRKIISMLRTGRMCMLSLLLPMEEPLRRLPLRSLTMSTTHSSPGLQRWSTHWWMVHYWWERWQVMWLSALQGTTVCTHAGRSTSTPSHSTFGTVLRRMWNTNITLSSNTQDSQVGVVCVHQARDHRKCYVGWCCCHASCHHHIILFLISKT